MKPVPVDAKRADWPRLAANAINALINGTRNFVRKDQGAAWTAPTGTATRATFATYAGQTVSDPPTQAEVQAIDDHLVELSERMKALVDDLQANGTLS